MSGARAWCVLREQPNYRRDAFMAGLAAAGYKAIAQELHTAQIDFRSVRAEDRLVVWNRYGTGEVLARNFEGAGGRVIVAENGYLSPDGRQRYALANDQHNGGGTWPEGGGERFAALGAELKPWRGQDGTRAVDGGHILVCPNRPFGPKGFAMAQDWAAGAARRLQQHTKREVRVRPHPGNWQKEPPKVPLADDLAGCWAVVTWASSAGVHALLAGVPVIFEAPWWICSGAAWTELRKVDSTPSHDGRPKTFARLAWAQWTTEEISSGLPFKLLAAL